MAYVWGKSAEHRFGLTPARRSRVENPTLLPVVAMERRTPVRLAVPVADNQAEPGWMSMDLEIAARKTGQFANLRQTSLIYGIIVTDDDPVK